MNFPDLNDDGKIDGKDAYIYEEILQEKKNDKNKHEPTGCCVVFLAFLLPVIFAAYIFVI